MADKKNLVIRVNYPKHGKKSEKRLSAPELITEWHTQRIFMVLGAFILLCVVAFFIINNGQHNADVGSPVVQSDTAKMSTIDGDSPGTEKQPSEYTEFEQISSIPPVTRVLKPAPEQVEPLSESNQAVNQTTKRDMQSNNDASINAAVTESKPGQIKNTESINNHQSPIDDKRVSRALLTTGLNNREPIDEFTPPVKIGNQQTVVLYYFTELKKLKDKALYHEWLRDGQLVAKRQLYIGDEHWRISSKMRFSEKNKGNWTVRLVDKSGQILNQKSFSVELDE